jgi:hypothetical protein
LRGVENVQAQQQARSALSPTDHRSRVIAVNVDDDAVIIEITASDERYDAWVPTAEAFIDAIHFDPPSKLSVLGPRGTRNW